MEPLEIFFLSTLKNRFQDWTSSPLPFLQGDPSTYDAFKQQCKNIYDFSKSLHNSSKPDPIPKLLLDNFDQEQIWGQVELFNKKEAAICLKAADVLTSCESDITLVDIPEDSPQDGASDEQMPSDVESEEELNMEMMSGDDSADGFNFEESDDNEDPEESEDEFSGKEGEKFEKTEVDDDFFSLRKMEKFLEAEDRKFENKQTRPKDDDIDYFEDIPSSNDEGLSDADEEDDMNEKSARYLKYSDYFDDIDSERMTSMEHVGTNSQSTESDDKKAESNFEKHQKSISKKIAAMEDKSLAQADWQMKGEVKGNTRPENSLLQETLQFDNVARPQADITEQHTKTLEERIKQRTLDEAWDDVKRIYKQDDDAKEYKKRILLDSSQSKLTLSEIYEKQYLDEKQKSGKKDVEEEESEEHTAIKKDMDDLFRKLDALSNFHFISQAPEPKIKLVTNVATIEREEVQPVAQAKSQVLAPEEIYSNKLMEEKSSVEKSSTDKKRERRKKKLQMKAKSKARLERLKKIDPEGHKVKQIEAIDQLKKASKLPGSTTRILQAGKQSKEKMTSQKFFSKLQENTTISGKRKLPT